MTRPFRFIVQMPVIGGDPAGWRERLRRIEDLGFGTVAISDHFSSGWSMDPLTTLAAAAEATTSLRLLTLVLGNDYRHPALVHRAAATIDVLSGGRMELGLGAGWMESDYRALGLPLDRADVRVERLAESIEIIRALFLQEKVSYTGRHYRVDELEGLPRPVQQLGPPILVGGGGRQVLRLAGRLADIAGIHCRMAGPDHSAAAVADFSAQAVASKVGWVHEAARSVGRDPREVELQFNVYLLRLTDSTGRTTEARNTFARLIEADPAVLADSPAVLTGSVEECVDRLLEIRERFGLSYLRLGDDFEAAAPIVARLAGR